MVDAVPVDDGVQEAIKEDTTVPGVALTPSETTATTLFKTDDPVEVISRARDVANVLKDVLRQADLIKPIQGKEFVELGGWQTAGTLLGVTTIVRWTNKVEHGYEARAEVITLDGRVIGGAEASCLSTERRGPWKSADDYAIKSMAQTRAQSKALRGVLGWIMSLAGYSPTPAEEMEDRNAPVIPDHAKVVQPPLTGEASAALVGLCGNDQQVAAQVWKTIQDRCDGIMPVAAAHAIKTVAEAING